MAEAAAVTPAAFRKLRREIIFFMVVLLIYNVVSGSFVFWNGQGLQCPLAGALFRPQAAVAILAFHGTCHEAFFKIFLHEGVNDQHGGSCHDDGSKS
mgnify:CR=1 FL=1